MSSFSLLNILRTLLTATNATASDSPITHKDLDELKMVVVLPIIGYLGKQIIEWIKKRNDTSAEEDKEFKHDVLFKLTDLTSNQIEIKYDVKSLKHEKTSAADVYRIVKEQLEHMNNHRR